MSERSGKGKDILLIGSVLLNVLVIGIFIGGSFGHKMHRGHHVERKPPPDIRMTLAPRQVIRHADKSHRKELREIAHNGLKELKQGFRSVGEARHVLHKTLIAEDFSSEESLRAYRALAEQEAEVREASTIVVLEMLDALPDEERQRLLKLVHDKHMRNMRKHHGPQHKRKDDDQEGR